MSALPATALRPGHPSPDPLLSRPLGGRGVLILAASFAVLALAAAIDGGSLLDSWDEPVARAVDPAPAVGVGFFRAVTALGGGPVVLPLAAVCALAAWWRCRTAALVIVFVSAVRPLLEWGLKEVVGRPRPDFTALTEADGPAFPSGHTFSAVVAWGLLGTVVALYTTRRGWRMAAAAAAVVVGVLVATSRVYLGVHWLSDVGGGLLAGLLLLVVAEHVVTTTHDDLCRPPPA